MLNKKPLNFSDKERDYMNKDQALVFISKWEFKETQKRNTEFLREVYSDQYNIRMTEEEIEAQLLSYIIQLNFLCKYKPMKYLQKYQDQKMIELSNALRRYEPGYLQAQRQINAKEK